MNKMMMLLILVVFFACSITACSSKPSTPSEVKKYANGFLESIKKSDDQKDILEVVSSNISWEPVSNVRNKMYLSYKVKPKLNSKEIEKVIENDRKKCEKVKEKDQRDCYYHLVDKHSSLVQGYIFGSPHMKEFVVGEELEGSLSKEFVKTDKGWELAK